MEQMTTTVRGEESESESTRRGPRGIGKSYINVNDSAARRGDEIASILNLLSLTEGGEQRVGGKETYFSDTFRPDRG